jgi:hypothetical protein
VRSRNRNAPSEMPEALAARQREHRLMVRVRPKMPVEPNADPWLVADEALDALDRVRLDFGRPHHRRRGKAVEDLDLVSELVRRLCWGPEDESP